MIHVVSVTTLHRKLLASAIGIVLGIAPMWLNDTSPLWPSRYSDEAQWVLEQLMSPGFLFSTLVGRGPNSFPIMITFNVLFFGVMAYSFLVEPDKNS